MDRVLLPKNCYLLLYKQWPAALFITLLLMGWCSESYAQSPFNTYNNRYYVEWQLPPQGSRQQTYEAVQEWVTQKEGDQDCQRCMQLRFVMEDSVQHRLTMGGTLPAMYRNTKSPDGRYQYYGDILFTLTILARDDALYIHAEDFKHYCRPLADCTTGGELELEPAQLPRSFPIDHWQEMHRMFYELLQYHVQSLATFLNE